MDEQYVTINPATMTLRELVILALHQITENDLDAFEFDIPGMSPDGPIVMHIEANIQKIGHG
jgi:hypothetical protein